MNKRYTLRKDFSLKKEILKYLVHWRWFLVSIFTTLFIAVVFLKKTNPVFNNKTKILIKEAEGNRGLTELAAFKDFDILEGSNNKNDEMEIINSKKLIRRVVDSLNLNIRQTSKIGFRNVDIYGISPLNVKFIWKPIGYRMKQKTIRKILISLLPSEKFQLVYEDEQINEKYNYDEPIILGQGILTVSKSNFFDDNEKLKSNKTLSPIEKIIIDISPKDQYTASLNKSILINPKNKRSNVIEASFKHSNRKKANDLLNNLIYQYNTDATQDKNLVAINTDLFINERIRIISQELDSVESNKVSFKKRNELTNIESESEIFFQDVNESKKRLSNLGTQLDLTEAMISYLTKKNRASDLLPANIGIENNPINSTITEYNKLVLERNKLLSENATEYNPFVVNLNNDIDSQKLNLIESLKTQKENLIITKNEISEERSKMNRKISSIPKIEKDYLDIERQQNIKQDLYLFLLKKREENSISMAVTSPVAKIIDASNSSNKPIFPKTIVILLLAIIFGFGVPFITIYLKDLLNTKVNTKIDLQNTLKDIPLLGEITNLKTNSIKTIGLNDLSEFGEAFRILRTNFNYLTNKRKREKKALRIFVTSTIKGEGKTFVSINTALSLADTNKKVLIIEADIRNPQLHQFMSGDKNKIGLSEYLYSDKPLIKDIIKTVKVNNRELSYIPSGTIPPNPSELLMNGKFTALLDTLEDNYDVIIVDTAPTMLVSDTLQISNTADITMYVIRADYTEKELLLYAKELNQEGKIQNMALILNGVKQNKSSYGYHYGYNNTKTSILKKIKTKFFG